MKMHRFGSILLLSGLIVPGAWAASPWDGEWEGQLRYDDLPCSPCRVSVSVRDGIGTAKGSVEIDGFRIEPDGRVFAQLRRGVQAATNQQCRLNGRAGEDRINASAACGSDAELLLTRRSAGTPPASAQQPQQPAAGIATAPPAAPPVAPPVATSNIGAGTQPVRLSSMEYGMPAGTRLGEFQAGTWVSTCGSGARRPITHNGRRDIADISGFRRDFDTALRRSGYSIEDASIGGGYVVMGTITAMDIVVCIREGTQPPQISGSGRVTVIWRVLTPLGDNVLYQATTSGAKDVPTSSRSTDGLRIILGETFTDAASRLAADAGFRDVVARPLPASAQQRITRATEISAVRGPRPFQGTITARMDHVLAATVVITSGGALGSGFVVDAAAGLILTNHHVVRSGNLVNVRFSNGDRVQGLVVRSDRERDVALVRVQRSGLKALPLRPARPILTEQVFAVGAPQGLEQTVTRGIVSAIRTLGNLEWIQSDAAVAAGSSGGPLLDASGNVIGISTLASARAAGFNLFVPIQDALARLGLTLSQ